MQRRLRALSACSQVQLARVGVRVLVLVDVVCVMLVVLIARVDVVHAVDTVFVAIFCSWRCTLYMIRVRPLAVCRVSRYSRQRRDLQERAFLAGKPD